MHGVHSFIYPGPGQRDTPVADLRTTLKFRDKSPKIASRPSSGGAGSVSLTFSSKLAVEDVFLHCYSDLGESEVGIPTSVGERSRNSDLGGRAKSEFRPQWSEFRPRWESDVRIPTSVGERSLNSDLAAIGKKARCSPPPTGGLTFFPGKNSDLGRLEASMPGRGFDTRQGRGAWRARSAKPPPWL